MVQLTAETRLYVLLSAKYLIFMKTIRSSSILGHVKEVAPYLEQKLDEIVAKHECAATRRGMGFMQGIVIQGRPVGEVVKAALAKGLLVISAGSDVLRIVPPLVITKEHIDKMAAILDECME